MASDQQKLQKLLDTFSQTPGAILFRGREMWQALEPAYPGWVLVLNDDLLPVWRRPEDVFR